MKRIINIFESRSVRFFAVGLTLSILTVVSVSMAWASEGGAEPRRIDTANVDKPSDIKPVGEDEAPVEHGGAVEEEHGAPTEEEHGAAAEGEESGHSPAWMIPGWQSIFTALAVIYFSLGVTLLPRIMAKEEH